MAKTILHNDSSQIHTTAPDNGLAPDGNHGQWQRSGFQAPVLTTEEGGPLQPIDISGNFGRIKTPA